MHNHIRMPQVIARLEENRLRYAVVSLNDQARIVVLERGGRVLGPFAEAGGESIFWLHEAFGSGDAFADLLASGAWNVGGERVWISPEIQYGVRDRSDFWRTLHVPEQVDPGNHVLDRTALGLWRLRQEMTLQAYNLASGHKSLYLEKLIRPIEDPLRRTSEYAQLVRDVDFAGFEQIVTLSETTTDDIVSETWNLVQINPEGTLLVPAVPCAEAVDYYEPVADLQVIHAHHVQLRITGDRRYKVGYKAAHVFGRVGYLNGLGEKKGYLIVRNFFVNPSAPYLEEPAHLPGGGGQAIHVYNDDGAFGGFGELECHGQAIGGRTGHSCSTDQFVLWLYCGPIDRLRDIALRLLGCSGLEGGQ